MQQMCAGVTQMRCMVLLTPRPDGWCCFTSVEQFGMQVILSTGTLVAAVKPGPDNNLRTRTFVFVSETDSWSEVQPEVRQSNQSGLFTGG